MQTTTDSTVEAIDISHRSALRAPLAEKERHSAAPVLAGWRFLLLALLMTISGHGFAAFQQSAGGDFVVSMEAENFAANTPQGAHQWLANSSPPAGQSGAGLVETTPNNGTNNNTSTYVTVSPRLDYQVNFVTTGTHYIFVRGYWNNPVDDSVHLGLNGQYLSSASAVHLPENAVGYVWSGVRRSFNVTATGVQTVNLWMREDGTPIDKIVLTTNPNYVPSGLGPAQSPTSGANQPPVARNDVFSVAQDSGTAALAVLADNGNGADSDPDNDPLTVTAVGTPSAGGSASISGTSILYAPATGYSGLETFSYTISDLDGLTSTATVSVTVQASGGGDPDPEPGGGTFLQSTVGDFIVSMEAENFAANTPQGAHQWLANSSPPAGQSGAGLMETTPNNGTNNNTSTYVTVSPRLDYQVNFVTTGTHYIFVRGYWNNLVDDSVHLGLNGQYLSSASAVHLPENAVGYVWSGVRRSFNVTATGVQTVNLWMREDGTPIDKIVLTTNPNYVPSGLGPAQSPTSGANQPPVARDDAFSVNQDSGTATLTVLVNNGSGADSDPNGDPLTVTAVGTPSAGGTASINGGGTAVLYTPATGYSGPETFSYTISDPDGATSSATVSITVQATSGPVNSPPLAKNDTFSVVQGSANNVLTVLLDNGSGADSDPESDPLTVTAVGVPSAGGAVEIDTNGTAILYTPASSHTGLETFSYTISDPDGASANATVSVTATASGGGDPGSGGSPGVFQQAGGSGFIVSMEAERFATNTPQGTHQWFISATPPAGQSGAALVETTPNVGTNNSTSTYVTASPRLNYQVNFVTTGTHYIFVRGYWNNAVDDSVHLGLNGQYISSASAVHLPENTVGYVWSRVKRSFNVPSTGVHTVNLWMREDGALIDKIVLTTNQNYALSGTGPPENAWESACPAVPSVQLVTPRTGHLQSANDLNVDTLTCLDPVLHAGWGVQIELNGGVGAGGAEVFRYQAPFATEFLDLPKTEHRVSARIVDGSGAPVAGTHVQDTADTVGIGDYYVAIGDSITSGTGDDITSDDRSADGRDSSRGFPPILNNLLTAARGYPHTVRNEGVGGITSAGGLDRLPTVLSAHPQATTYLVKYGMNDARPWLPVPSGLGLNPGDAGYPGTFKDNMQRIINALKASGKSIALAKINIALADGTNGQLYPDPTQGARTLLIIQYNQVIDELVLAQANGIVIVAPDLYSYFLANYGTEYADPIHPNGIGYQSMANLWFQVLTQ